MRHQQVYATRRGVRGTARRLATRTSGVADGFGRNFNTVRHTPKAIGSVSNAAIVALLVLIVGLIYVSQGTQATNYDYQLSEVEAEIAELVARKEDLAVERARLTSVATAEGSTVAANMEVAAVGGYAE